MPRLCLMFCRLSLAAWFGAGALFLTVILGLRNSPLFSDEARFNHPRVLFPLYYSLEFPSLIAAVATAWIAATTSRADRRSLFALAIVATINLTLAAFDYLIIYRPLADMLESQVLNLHFTRLHQESRWINATVLLLCGICAAWSCWMQPASTTLHGENSNGQTVAG